MSSSTWIASSLMIFSARAISWTWKRTVSKHSKTRVMIGPERHPPVALAGDDLGPVVLAHPLVGPQVEHVVQGEAPASRLPPGHGGPPVARVPRP